MKTLVYNVTVKTNKNVNFLPVFNFDVVKGSNAPEFVAETIAETDTQKVYKVVTTIKNDDQVILTVTNKENGKFTAKVMLVEATSDEGFAVSIQGRRTFIIKNPLDEVRKINIKEGMRKKAFVKKMAAAKEAKRAKMAAMANVVVGMTEGNESEQVVYQEA